MLGTRGHVEPFELGATDRRASFLIPERLYGRDVEVAALNEAFQRSIAGQTTFIGVKGPAGIGKTALIRELLPSMAQGGLLVSGVCNPVQRTPYAPIVGVLREIAASVLAGTEESVAFHKARYEVAIEGEGGLLQLILPELVSIMGPQAEMPDMSAAETRERVQGMLIRLLCSYHEAETPLVVFLDDLQWADPGTIEVLRRILSDQPLGGPLFLLAWRDSEVGESHPLARALPSDLDTITPGPLDLAEIERFLGDTMSVPPAETAALAGRVLTKTGGNAFFVRRFAEALHADGHIRYDVDAGRWTWSLERIDALQATSNVADLLARRLATLDAEARTVLGSAACLGKRFEIEALRRVSGVGLSALCMLLMEAVELGLLAPVGDAGSEIEALAGGTSAGVEASVAQGSVRFVHDEIFDATYRILDEESRRGVHLKDGRTLLARWTPSADPFPVADALNRAAAVLTGDERVAAAQVNLEAGRRAYDSAAFEAALHYLGAGVGLTQPADWATHHETTFRLHLGAAQAQLMAPSVPSSVDFAAIAMAHAESLLDRIAVQQVTIRHHIAQYAFADTIRCTLEALRWAGVNLPEAPHAGHIAVALGGTMWRAWGHTQESLRKLPVNEDPVAMAAMRLMAEGASSAYYTSAFLLPIMLCRMVDLTLQRGLSGQSAYAFSAFAFIQVAVKGDVKSAWMWAQAAREVVARFDARDMAPKVELMVIGFVESRRESLGPLADKFVTAQNLARDVGDAEYVGLCAMNHSTFSFMAGVELSEVARRTDADLATCREMRQEQCVNMLLSQRQALACLRGEAADPAKLAGEYMTLDAMVERMLARGDKSGVSEVRFHHLRLSLLFGGTETLVPAIELAQKSLDDVPGSPSVAGFHLNAALAWARWMQETRKRGKGMSAIRKHLRTLRAWAVDGADNHAHKVLLVEAVLAELEDRPTEALGLYDAAIRQAQRSGILLEQALCLEWAARGSLRAGQLRNAALLLEDARGAWLGWGCTPRLAVLAELEGRLEGAHVRPWAPQGRLTDGTTTLMDTGSIDIMSVIKAARVLSSEIELSVLLPDLMRIVLENAGGTSAVLALQRTGGLAVVATSTAGAGGVNVELVTDARAPETLNVAWAPLIRFVARTAQPVVVPDGTKDLRFFRGCGSPPLSALCVPLVLGGELVGVMLVTNELVRYAFTDDRHEVVGLICSQAAVSIINAQLYEDLRLSLEVQRAMTASFERFVPKAFLEQLGRGSILDVGLGEQVLREMAVLFMDIRGFTTISEQLTPRETFELVNALLARLGPIVTANGGFIDKYIGDAIMALFPRSPDDALNAALQIQQAVAAFRAEADRAPHNELRVGVGVHRGPMMLGTIGESERMEGTVISDAVNIASRLEGLTKDFKVEVLASASTIAALNRPGDFETRFLGERAMKGRGEPLGICEVVSGKRVVAAEARGASIDEPIPVG